MDEFYGRKSYTLDDSSGACVECTAFTPAAKVPDSTAILAHLNEEPRRLDTIATTSVKDKAATKTKGKGKAEDTKTTEHGVMNPNVPWDDIDVGTVVKIKGRIGIFRDIMQVQIVSAFVVKTTDGEVKFWNEAGTFKKEVLGKDWVVSKEVEEKLLKKLNRKGKKVIKDAGDEEVKRKRIEEDHDDGRNAAKRLLQRETTKRKQREAQEEDDRNAAKQLLEQETKKQLEDEEIQRKKKEVEEIQERKDALAREERRRKRKYLEDARNRIKYPSLAVRKAAAGKYDLLGI